MWGDLNFEFLLFWIWVCCSVVGWQQAQSETLELEGEDQLQISRHYLWTAIEHSFHFVSVTLAVENGTHPMVLN
jgi:hypothetical protein